MSSIGSVFKTNLAYCISHSKITFLLPMLHFQAINNRVVFADCSNSGNFTNLVRKHASSPGHLSANTALKLLGKLRVGEAMNEGARLSRIMYNERARKNRLQYAKHHIKASYQRY